jgi:hypothetical protein
MHHPAWDLVIVGVLIAGVGLLWLLAPSIPLLGKLSGDIVIERQNLQFYFTVVTCNLLRVGFTAIMWVVRYFSR